MVVKIADRQWRYSRFPEVPLFGRAARESRIEESLHAEREVLSERFATLSFDVQKTQRLHQAFSRLSAVIWRWRLSLTRKRNPSTEQPSRRTGTGVE